MRSEKEIGQIIRQLRGTESLRSFARRCDTTHTTIDNLEKGFDFRTGKPAQAKMATLQKIATARPLKPPKLKLPLPHQALITRWVTRLYIECSARVL